MNAAGNAELSEQLRSKNAYSSVILVLGAWLALCGVLLITRVLNRFGTVSNRELYDAAALSSLTVFITVLIVTSFLKVRTKEAVMLSSALLVVTYYARLLYLLQSERGTALILPLFNIVEFERVTSGTVTLDLGQIGLYTLLYFLAKDPSVRTYLRRAFTPSSSRS
ncbi:MAG: hypothetical protein QXR49_01255 [Sulfolobales archaeon]